MGHLRRTSIINYDAIGGVASRRCRRLPNINIQARLRILRGRRPYDRVSRSERNPNTVSEIENYTNIIDTEITALLNAMPAAA